MQAIKITHNLKCVKQINTIINQSMTKNNYDNNN